ncbi:MAG: Undecaprenyl-diphosphatase [Microgenomates group bacterium GW2011_GWF2_47_9]|nr:MAG: Undecaprenyl-diphosphatase [Microgenomates group bacterium GW2011_GWF2_47_9]
MFQTIILGVVQGLTEFLPISSSGHLVLFHSLFGFKNVDPAFDVFVQGGTVLSVLIFFRRKILALSSRDLLLLFIATLPAGIVGLLVSPYIDSLFTSLSGVTLGFFLTTAVVWSSKYVKALSKVLSPRKSFLIGVSQAFAILPGLSRSGTTIATSLLLGIKPEVAFTFSFLLSIPTVMGASILGAKDLVWDETMTLNYLAGFLAATITGYFALVLLAKIVKKGEFYKFAPYTFTLGLLSLLIVLLR